MHAIAALIRDNHIVT